MGRRANTSSRPPYRPFARRRAGRLLRGGRARAYSRAVAKKQSNTALYVVVAAAAPATAAAPDGRALGHFRFALHRRLLPRHPRRGRQEVPRRAAAARRAGRALQARARAVVGAAA